MDCVATTGDWAEARISDVKEGGAAINPWGGFLFDDGMARSNSDALTP
jgi:hypothetical protein